MWFGDEEVGLRPALLDDPMGAEAFILGAGFSRAISPSMPLVNDLVEPLHEFLGRSRSVGAATVPRLKNVELFLSSLAVPQPFLDESSNLNNRALFIEANRWLGEHMFNAQQHALGSPLPAWLAGLVRTWHARRSTVITLNYDTLVESAVMSLDLNLTGPGGRVLPQHTYANPVRFAASEWGGTFNRYDQLQPTFTYCKLHGSLSWWRSSSIQQPPLDVEVWKDAFNTQQRASWADVRRRVMVGEPMFVPPTLAKSDYLDNDLVRANWRRAHDGLSRATTIIIMGYSFPAGDMQTAALLGTATRAQQIIVVDLNPVEVIHRVAEAALPRTGTISPFKEQDDPIVAWSERWKADPQSLYGKPSP